METPAAQDTPGRGRGLTAVESRTAGNRIIRGGAVRATGYVLSTGLTAVAYALLLRHLGVVDFGRFSTVVALVTLAGGLAEAGLQMTGQAVYAEVDREGQRALLGNLVGIRLVLTPVAVLACTGFALVAGYQANMVVGTLVAGAGAVLVATAGTMALPLSMDLRYGALTAVEVGRQLVLVAGMGALVLAGAALGAFFAIYLVSGIAMLVLALALVAGTQRAWPRIRWGEWRPILVRAAPLAVSLALNIFYLKVLLVMASLTTTPTEVGLFATASRVTEVLVGLPTFMVGVAFPLLAHAGARDEARLAYAMQRIAEVTLLVAGLFALVLFVAAEPIVQVFGGAGYGGAVPVLRIQAFALLGASLTQAWILAVIAVGAQRSLIWVNAAALASVASLGAVLIPSLGAQGASATAVAGETVLSLTMLVVLVRARPALRPTFGFVPRLAVALGLGLLCGLLPVPPVLAAGCAVLVFTLTAWLLGAIPIEIFHALLRRDPVDHDLPQAP